MIGSATEDSSHKFDRLHQFATTIRRLPTPYHYLFAIVLVCVAHVAAWLGGHQATPLLLRPRAEFYVIAIMFVAFATNGMLPVALSVTLCVLAANLLDTPFSWTPSTDDGIRLLAFVIVAILMWSVARSERRARHQAMLRAQAAIAAAQTKDYFLAAVSHDLRQPLAGIKKWLSTLRKSCKLSYVSREEVEQALDGIENCYRQQDRLVNDLLDVARISAGKVILQLQSLALDNVLGNACDLAQTGAKARGVDLIVPEPTGLRITADRDRIHQVFWALISNAVKFTERGGQVTVSVDADAECTRVRIVDTGCGLTTEQIRNVFDPFATNRVGLGLGLIISRRLAEMHGGRIDVSSAGRGRGAAFVVTLPAAPAIPIDLDVAANQ